MLRDMLVNGVVCEARERVNRFFHVDFGFWHAARFRQAQHGVNDSAQFTLGPQLREAAAFRSRPGLRFGIFLLIR